MHSTPHKNFLAGVVFNYFKNTHGRGPVSHQRINNRYDLYEQKVYFDKKELRFCLLIEHGIDFRLLTVFDDSQKEGSCEGKVLVVMSNLVYLSEDKKVTSEVQHLYNDAFASEALVSEIHKFFDQRDVELKEKWPNQRFTQLQVA